MKNFNAVIKNFRTYNKNIKLASTLILNFQKKISRYGAVGVSTDIFGKYWFFTPNGKVLFKTGNKNDKETRLLNEIVCYKLAKSMGIDCAVYQSAQMDNKEKTWGVASYNFLQKGEKVVSFAKLLGMQALNIGSIMEDLLSELIIYQKDDIKFNYAQIAEGLYKMAIFDLLTFQSDRHLGNISLIVDDKNRAKLSPLYDNEYAFFEMSWPFFDPNYYNVEDFVDNFFCGDRTMHICKENKGLGLEKFNEFVEQIVSMAKSKPKYKKILIDILKNANLKKVYKELEKQGFVINQDYKEFTIHLFDFAKSNLVERAKQVFISGNSKNLEEKQQEK